MLATPATTSMEDAIAARGAPVWYQLYASPKWEVAEALVKRAERAGSPVVVVTVDRVAGRNQETFFRLKAGDTRDCKGCHAEDLQQSVVRKPAYAGIDLKGLPNLQSANMSWDFIKRLRGATKMKIVIKGILTAEDAKLAVANGVDGLVVSNHGGRGEDSGRATIDVLPEIVDAVQARSSSSSTAAFAAGPTSPRRSPWARTPSASGGRTCGDSRVREPAWRRSSRFSAPKRVSR